MNSSVVRVSITVTSLHFEPDLLAEFQRNLQGYILFLRSFPDRSRIFPAMPGIDHYFGNTGLLLRKNIFLHQDGKERIRKISVN